MEGNTNDDTTADVPAANADIPVATDANPFADAVMNRLVTWGVDGDTRRGVYHDLLNAGALADDVGAVDTACRRYGVDSHVRRRVVLDLKSRDMTRAELAHIAEIIESGDVVRVTSPKGTVRLRVRRPLDDAGVVEDAGPVLLGVDESHEWVRLQGLDGSDAANIGVDAPKLVRGQYDAVVQRIDRVELL